MEPLRDGVEHDQQFVPECGSSPLGLLRCDRRHSGRGDADWEPTISDNVTLLQNGHARGALASRIAAVLGFCFGTSPLKS
jgi:hypothetical protein